MSKIITVKINYIVKRPSIKEHRRSWLILERRTNHVGLVKTSKVRSDAVEAVNRAYQSGSQTQEQCEKQIRDIVARFYRILGKTPGTETFNQANYDILGEMDNPAPGTYWREVYGRKKRIKDRRSSYYDLRRAIEAIKGLSLLTATEEELQDAVDKLPDNKQRRVVNRLMPIIRWLGRPKITLELAYEQHPDPKFLLWEEVPTFLDNLEPVERSLCGMAFYSGLRQGELFALEAWQVGNGQVRVFKQQYKNLKVGPVKNRLPHRIAYLMPEGEKYFKDWFEIEKSERDKLRTKNWAVIARRASTPVVGSERAICFHDLRHSNAIHLVSNGVEMPLVAQHLGNKLEVCEKYYSGRVLKSSGVSMIALKMAHALELRQAATPREQPSPAILEPQYAGVQKK